MGADSPDLDDKGVVDEAPKNEGEIKDEEGSHKKIPYPKSVFFIISNEFCERFSYYGMRTILSLYFRDILRFTESDSTVIYHTFNTLAYFFPLLGAILCDSWLGKFRTILYVSIIYAAGNILLALASAAPIGLPQVPFSLLALLLIAVGTGGIKPCVSAFGGDQFVLPQQEQQLVTFFSVFYFSINAGSLISTFLTPVLREDVHCFGENSCYPLAFAVPGVLMIVAWAIFFLGAPMYKMSKPEGNIVVQVVKCIWYGAKKNYSSEKKMDHWLDHAAGKFGQTLVDDIKVTLKVLVVFIPLPIFWSLYDQQGSAWIFQATRMDGRLGSWTLLPDQMQVLNPLLILIFIPLFTYGVYPCFARMNMLKTPLQRMVVGGFLGAAAFGVAAGVAAAVEATEPNMPSSGQCQIRMYNPFECKATFNISRVLNEDIPALGYLHKDVPCKGPNNTFPYILNSDCPDFPNPSSGSMELQEAKGYFLYPSTNGVLVFHDDISKAEDGFPKIRTLISNPDVRVNVSYMSGSSKALTLTSDSYVFGTLSPGTYKFGDTKFEFLLGGVYTVLAQLDGETIKNPTMFEITKPNSVHVLVQLPQLFIITAAEILFSITGLEFSYSQAPSSMKSVMTACFLLTSAIGNIVIIIIESAKPFDKQSLEFSIYCGLMILDMILFTYIAVKYKYNKKPEEGDEQGGDDKDK